MTNLDLETLRAGNWHLPTACRGKLIVLRDSYGHLVAHRRDIHLLPKACKRLQPLEFDIDPVQVVDFGRVIGFQYKTATSPISIDTPTLFATRLHRDRPSRVVLDVQPQPSSSVVVIAKRLRRGNAAVLRSFYVGDRAPPEPHSRNAGNAALRYWCENALLYEPEEYFGPPFEATWGEVITQVAAARHAKRLTSTGVCES